jgi:hypothetical protein
VSASATGRWVVAGVLAACLAVVTTLSLGSWWVRGLVYDTDTWMAAMGPVIDDPVFQQAVSDQIAGEVSDRVQAEVDDLPPLVQTAVADVVDRLTGVVDDTVSTVVSSPEFAAAWVEANEAAHEQIAGTLTGSNEVVGVQGGRVSIENQVFVDAGAAALEQAGLGAVVPYLPQAQGSFVLLQSDGLGLVQAGLRFLDALGAWVWLLAGGLAVAVVAVAPRRLRGLAAAAAATVVGAVLTFGGLALLRSSYLASTPVLPDPAKDVIFTALSASLREAATAVLLVAAVVALAAMLADLVASRRGPARGADTGGAGVPR